MRKILFALLFAAFPVFATTPTISSASLSSGTLTISGSNFGSKSTAAPFFWQDFSSAGSLSSLGYSSNAASWGTNGYGSSIAVDLTSPRVSGIGTLKMSMPWTGATGEDHDFFPKVAVDTSNQGAGALSSDYLYFSFWLKAVKVSGSNTGGIQIKGPRIGYSTAPASSVDYYFERTSQHTSSFYLNADSTWDYLHHEVFDSSGSGISAENVYQEWAGGPQPWNTSGWNFFEVKAKLSDVAASNGTLNFHINNFNTDAGFINAANSTAIPSRLSGASGVHFNYVFLVPGFDIGTFDANATYELYYSEHYIDTTPQRIRLGNASTLSASTGFTMCIPIAWSIGLTCSAAHIPSGYDWVYVTNELGETNATGFAYATGGAGDATATATGSTLTLSSGSATASGTATASASGTTLSLSSGSATAVGDTPTETRIKNAPRSIIKDRIKDRISKRKAKVIELREVATKQPFKKAA